MAFGQAITMIPRTLSASSLSVAQRCMARWKTEYFDRVRGPGGSAANLGTTCHAALESFINNCFGGTLPPLPAEFNMLVAYYNQHFIAIYGPDLSVPHYQEGLDMLANWYNRTVKSGDLASREIISTERKEKFDLPVMIGGIRQTLIFNFIMDRLDKIGPDEYEIVDYKTQQARVDASELKQKLQAKVYAMAVQIKYPEAKKIWVTFDLLRHEPVSVAFNKEENTNTWKELKNLAQMIVDTEPSDARETINAECRFCVRKATCTTLQSNIAGGGIHSITEIGQAVHLYKKLKQQQSGVTQLLGELEEFVMMYAADKEITEWDESGTPVKITQSGRRVVRDPEAAAELVGPEIMKKYGSLGVTDIEKIIKSGEVDAETAASLKKLMVRQPGKISVNIKTY